MCCFETQVYIAQIMTLKALNSGINKTHKSSKLQSFKDFLSSKVPVKIQKTRGGVFFIFVAKT